ncbi:sulfite exporter TauE/SafE family protein [Kribbella sancticallisti]|uniref:Probable membrane transporter protein n=1 Tax=Kribbella sancticallisti TaxID=460087 RepID=A0ABN2CG78_9ACTN
MPQLLIVLLAGVAAGALNSVGGGGSFLAFPVLVAAGLTPVTANAATTVALLPGVLASLWIYRNDLIPLQRTSTAVLTGMTVAGGALGAALLLLLPSASFETLVPGLLVFATLVLIFGRRIGRRVRATRTRTILLGQFVLAIYGGYFGGAVGLLMVAFWSVAAGLDPAKGNPLRIAQLAAAYLTATAIFLVASDVLDRPHELSVLIAGALVGGLTGAAVARKLPARVLRALVLTSAITVTAAYLAT